MRRVVDNIRQLVSFIKREPGAAIVVALVHFMFIALVALGVRTIFMDSLKVDPVYTGLVEIMSIIVGIILVWILFQKRYRDEVGGHI